MILRADREPRCFYCGSNRHDTDDCTVAPDEFVQRAQLGLAA